MSITTNSGMRIWHTLQDVRNAHTGHWFDASTLRFFSSRLPDPYTRLIGGRYFVSSEQYRPLYGAPEARMFTIREVMSDAKVETVGEFQGYSTRRAAERAARDLPTEYSPSLMSVLESDTHNGTGWIRTSKQLAKYTGAPLEDAQATIRARAAARRRARRAV